MTEAERLARHPAVARSGCEPLFSRDAARAVVEDATRHRLAILDLSGGLRLPWREAVRASHQDALGFLDRQPDNLLFSIVIASEGEFG